MSKILSLAVLVSLGFCVAASAADMKPITPRGFTAGGCVGDYGRLYPEGTVMCRPRNASRTEWCTFRCSGSGWRELNCGIASGCQ